MSARLIASSRMRTVSCSERICWFGGCRLVGAFMGKCIFCEAVGKLTKEHIWADWLKKYIPKDMPNYTAHRQMLWRGGRKTDRQVRLVGGDIRSMRVKCVCNSKTHAKSTPRREGCNDGRMGKLQEAAKPIVIPLIEGKSIALTARSQQILAGWIAIDLLFAQRHMIRRYLVSTLSKLSATDRGMLTSNRSAQPQPAPPSALAMCRRGRRSQRNRISLSARHRDVAPIAGCSCWAGPAIAGRSMTPADPLE